MLKPYFGHIVVTL